MLRAAALGIGVGMGLGLALLAAYAPAWNGPWQFDDWNVIVGAANARSLADWWAHQPGLRPLLKLSWALQHETGAGPAGFRAVNLLIHLANTALVVQMLRRWRPGAGWALPLLAGALFAAHPAQTEAVSYLSGRSSALSAGFVLLSIVLWQVAGSAVDEPGPRRRGIAGTSLASWASPLCFALALGCKETVWPLPLLLVLMARCEGAPARLAFRRAAPHAAVLLLAGLAALSLPAYRALLAHTWGGAAVGNTALTQLYGLAWLLGQMLMPWQLCADPALPLRSVAQAGIGEWVAACAALAAIALGLAWSLRAAWQGRTTGLALAWFALWLLPTQSLWLRLDVASDRQLYLPLVAPAWLLATALWQPWPASAAAPVAGWAGQCRSLVQRWPLSLLGRALALGLLAGCLLLTQQRQAVYRSETAFWRDVLRQAPHNARAHNNLAWALAQLPCGDADEITAHFGAAVLLAPQDSRARLNLALWVDGALPGSAPCSAPEPTAKIRVSSD